MRLCLNMIVRNESARIIRALASAAPHIACWSITDTGSTDGTQDLVKKFFSSVGLPGQLTTAEFHDFAQARNAALVAAQNFQADFDYILLFDADMELKVINPKWTDLLRGERSYDMFQLAGVLHYQNRRLVKRGEAHGYRGVTHEYLDVDTGGCIPKEAAHFIDYADGSNRPDKFKRDIKLLKQGLKDEPGNARYMYYLAQSYKDAGKPEKAIKWYERRIAAGGWDEEVWSSQFMMAQCYRDLKDEANYVLHSVKAHNLRPSRAEPLFELARYYREKPDQQAASLIFSETALQIARTTDALFVNDYVYDCGAWDEFAIAAFYSKDPHKKVMGFKANNMLALKPGPYADSRDLARTNMFHYLPALKDLAPSWEWQKINFEAPENWTAMNPSVTVHEGQLRAIIRTVNYRMDEHGRYLIRGTADGSINNSNPISTRNWLVHLSDEFSILTATEIAVQAGLPCEYPLVVGFEDMRLFSYNNQLRTTSTVRQFDADGLAEQVRARIDGENTLTDIVRMKREPRLYEKNWAAIVEEDLPLRYMYRPGQVVDDMGQNISVNRPAWDIGHFSGGSQLVRLPLGNWIYLIHEARFIPGTQLRYYSHRFVQVDPGFSVTKVSVPFCFNEKAIEFAAGMCLHPNKPDTLVISYGFKDAEARIGTVLLSDMERFLGAS